MENTIVQALVGCRGNVLLRDDVDALLAIPGRSPGLDAYSLAHVEKRHIAQTLSQLDWNKTRTASLLGITLPTLCAVKSKNTR